MHKPSRHPVTLILALMLPVLLVVGLWLGGHPEDMPGFLRSTFVADQKTRVVDEAIERIASDYYRQIPTSRLSDASISGVVASLHDRFSHYLDASEFGEFVSPPHFTGIGVAVDPNHGGLLIAKVFDSSPAERAGLKPGERIIAVNGHSLNGVPDESAITMIKGLPGTDVTLTIEGSSAHGRHGATRTVKITRAVVSEPVVASEMREVHGVKIGVVALATFSPGAHAEVREAVEKLLREGAKGIVFDLRSNGGGLVEEAQLIASIFIPSGVIVSTRGRTQPSQTLYATGDAISPSIPVAVLVDSDTASARRSSPPPFRITAGPRSSAHTPSERGSSRRRSRSPTAGRSTSPSASTSPRTGATSGAEGSNRVRA